MIVLCCKLLPPPLIRGPTCSCSYLLCRVKPEQFPLRIPGPSQMSRGIPSPTFLCHQMQDKAAAETVCCGAWQSQTSPSGHRKYTFTGTDFDKINISRRISTHVALNFQSFSLPVYHTVCISSRITVTKLEREKFRRWPKVSPHILMYTNIDSYINFYICIYIYTCINLNVHP